jgi:hypothetical protein
VDREHVTDPALAHRLADEREAAVVAELIPHLEQQVSPARQVQHGTELRERGSGGLIVVNVLPRLQCPPRQAQVILDPSFRGNRRYGTVFQQLILGDPPHRRERSRTLAAVPHLRVRLGHPGHLEPGRGFQHLQLAARVSMASAEQADPDLFSH